MLNTRAMGRASLQVTFLSERLEQAVTAKQSAQSDSARTTASRIHIASRFELLPVHDGTAECKFVGIFQVVSETKAPGKR